MFQIEAVMNTLQVLNSLLFFAVCDAAFGGPYEAAIKKLELCRDRGEDTLRFGTRITKISRTSYVYDNNVTLPYPLDEKVRADVHMAVWGNGGWKDNFFHWTLDCSNVFAMFPEYMKRLTKAANVENKCPIPKGHHYIDHFVFDLDTNIPVFPYGKYRATLNLMREKLKFGCYKMYIDVNPKSF